MKKIDIRAGNGTLSFTITEDDGTVTTYPYPVKSDMSLPANLREAFREQPYLRVGPTDCEGKILAAATLSVVSPIMLMPDDGDHDFSAADIDMVYGEVMTGHTGAREVGSPCEWRGGARHCSRAMVGESGLETC